MVRKFLMFFGLLLVLVGCQSTDDSNHDEHDSLSMVEVDLMLKPENPAANEEVTFTAHVTQDGENVEDANEVMFEIYMDGQEEDHDMIEVEHSGDGEYTFTKSFEMEGKYFVISHVTARDMHNMPRKEFHVGEMSENSSTGTEANTEKESSHH